MKPPRGRWETLDHTADVGLDLTAPIREGIYAAAILGMVDQVTPLAGVVARETQEVTVEATDRELLLVALLDELLFRFETAGWLTAEVAAIDISQRDATLGLHAHLRGERYDSTLHPIKVLLKAVTYHELHLAPASDGTWRGRVIFDI